MTAAGIIAEYNPFHNGHAYMLSKVKSEISDAAVIAMSTSFVQRGEPAVLSTQARVKAALANSADLVVALPVPWAMSGAQNFAAGGVSVLGSLGVVRKLAFGSESADMELLEKVSKCINSDATVELMRKYLSEGLSFAAARQRAVEQICPEAACVLGKPNDILAVEYMNAVKSLGVNLTPHCIKRQGVGHDCAAEGSSASASAVRELMQTDGNIADFVPEETVSIIEAEKKRGRAPASLSNIERAVLYKLRTSGVQEIAQAPDVSEGIENRIAFAAQEACSLDEVYAMAKTKRYTHARIRRIVMSTFLGITAKDAEGVPPYIRILGFSGNGKALLRQANGDCGLPVVMKYSDVKKLDDKAKRVFELECRAADIHSLCFPVPAACASVQKFTPVIMK